MVTTEQAMKAIESGEAHGHASWLILTDLRQREHFALRPETWEGSGQYQAVHFSDRRKMILVKTPEKFPTQFPVARCHECRKEKEQQEGGADVTRT